jgi:hypothetical protein
MKTSAVGYGKAATDVSTTGLRPYQIRHRRIRAGRDELQRDDFTLPKIHS